MSPVPGFRFRTIVVVAIFQMLTVPTLPASPRNALRPTPTFSHRCSHGESLPELWGAGEDNFLRFVAAGTDMTEPCFDLAAASPAAGEASAAVSDPSAPPAAPAARADQPPAPAHPAIKYASSEQEDAILHARTAVLNILHSDNGCSAWLHKARPDVDEMFSSLTYAVDRSGPAMVTKEVGYRGYWIEHGPYVASTFQSTGPGTTITINANGAFFQWKADLQTIRWPSAAPRRDNQWRAIHAGPFEGGTLPAQVITLLHELSHVVGAIPIDGFTDKGIDRSQSNTEEVLRHCRVEAKAAPKDSGSSLQTLRQFAAEE